MQTRYALHVCLLSAVLVGPVCGDGHIYHKPPKHDPDCQRTYTEEHAEVCVPTTSNELESVKREVVIHLEEKECFTQVRPECKMVSRSLPARRVCFYSYTSKRDQKTATTVQVGFTYTVRFTH